ncbi:MAG: hypothetical protein NTZ34_02080 [Chloroflexi bacterium]|nr:hypothetical protein [Chloroflexota bacterium]
MTAFFVFDGISAIMRGGKRPGAGAPKGNINRMVHGRRSKLLKRIVDMLKDREKCKKLAEFVSQNG